MSDVKICAACAGDLAPGDARCTHCGAAGGRSVRRLPYAVFGALVLALSVAAIVFTRQIEARRGGNETGIIGALKTIGTAQSLFREADKEGDGHLDYGTLSELANPGGGSHLIDGVLATGTKGGYLFEVSYGSMTSEFIWFGTARPKIPGVTGDRYFCTNHEGVIFYTWSAPFRLNAVNCTIPAGGKPVG